jgi:4-hydroxy-tetrahydrodipicolinate synthase
MINGSLVALVTPFRDDEIDEDALQHMVHWHIEQGTNGIVPVGTTGEAATLSKKECGHMIRLVVQAAAGRVFVLAGAGSNSTHRAILNNERAQKLGADATLHVAGYYNRPSQEGLFRHFEAVSNAGNIPIFVYNIPSRTNVDILPETMARIAALANVAGVKDATADISRPIRERLLVKGEFAFLSGDDSTAVAYNAAGGNGCVSVTANIAPGLCAALQAACHDGDYTLAADIQKRLMPLHRALFAEPSPAGVKYAASLLGHCDAFCRLPMVPLSDNSKSAISKAMSDLGLT